MGDLYSQISSCNLRPLVKSWVSKTEREGKDQESRIQSQGLEL